MDHSPDRAAHLNCQGNLEQVVGVAGLPAVPRGSWLAPRPLASVPKDDQLMPTRTPAECPEVRHPIPREAVLGVEPEACPG